MKNEIDAVLRSDHELLERIARELRSCTQTALARLKFKQFRAALGGHLAALRKVVYPELKTLGWPDVSSELLVVQARVTHLFAQALTLNAESAAFGDVLAELLDVMQQMVDGERGALLPLLSRRMDSAQRLSMGLEAQRYLSPESEHEALENHYPVSEWLEEAKLVLGGLDGAPASSV